MCGIVGCVGHENATEFVVTGLKSLEYRGYDSAGIAYQTENDLAIVRTLGEVAGLGPQLPETAHLATAAIGHTRWATHGGVTLQNTHPHMNNAESIAVVHNGTIENHQELRSRLTDIGYLFRSQTDTEVIPHLLDHYYRQGLGPEEAFEKTTRDLIGAYAILSVFADEPDTMYAARLGSPLVLGVNGSEHFAASDPSVIVDQTKRAIFLEDNELAVLAPNGYRSRHIKHGTDTTRAPENLKHTYEKAEIGTYPHFMLKEIYESADTVRSATAGRINSKAHIVKLDGIENPQSPETKEKLRTTDRFIIVACGTSYYAGLIGERLIEDIAGIPVEVHLASEFKESDQPISRNTAVIAVSQSGETADTIAALKKAEEKGLLLLGVNNSPGSTIDRMTAAGIHCRAGKEVAVASTKAFISQVTAFAEIALALAKTSDKTHQELMKELEILPYKIEQVLERAEEIKLVAEKYQHHENFLFMGRGYEYPSALEGALKLREVSYINANGISAGEMKHGTIALIDKSFPTLAIATDSPTYSKNLSNIEEIRARKGPVVALASDGDDTIHKLSDDVIYVPRTLEQTQPIINAVALQLFAYYIATTRGINVDRPRNLAKSVTVE